MKRVACVIESEKIEKEDETIRELGMMEKDGFRD